MVADLLDHCRTLTRYALGLPSHVSIEDICNAPETCIFPDGDLFYAAVEHVRICVVVVDYIVTALDNQPERVMQLKLVLQRLVTSSLDVMTDNAQLDTDGCNAFFDLISRIFTERDEANYDQICIYKPELADLDHGAYIVENRLAHIVYDFAVVMHDLITLLEDQD